MLEGIEIKVLKKFADERGFFTEIMKRDREDIFQEDVVQANFSISYPGMVRAWHRHLRGQIDCFVVLKGALKICAYDDETQELDEIVPKIMKGRADDERCNKPWDWFYPPYK